MLAASYALSLSMVALLLGLTLALAVNLALYVASLAREAAIRRRPLLAPISDGTPRKVQS